MNTKVARTTAPRDYPTLLAILAILLSVAVIAGIIFNYAGRGDTDDISARITSTHFSCGVSHDSRSG
jgi:hypothetical protein